jgi:hypothetical protein
VELTSLRDLLRPDRVEIIIEHYWQKNGERPSLYTIDLASKLLALARNEALSDVDNERLNEIRLAVEQYRSTGLTEKNRKLIRQIAQSDVWRKVVRLPQRLMAEARSSAKTKPYRAAVTAQLAISILILIRAPIRMQNLSSICIGINLVKPRGPGAPYMLVFPDYDVKNSVPLEFAFNEATSALIDEYIFEHRPQLMQGANHDGPSPVPATSTNGQTSSPIRYRSGSGRSSGSRLRRISLGMRPPTSCSRQIPAIMSSSGEFLAIAAVPLPGTFISGSRASRLRASSERWLRT